MNDVVVALEGVSKGFKGRPLLRDVTAAIPEGSITAITGPNGTGKSVLLKMVCGFLLPDSGTVRINERFMSRRRDFPEQFGVIIDRPGSIAHLSGFENLRLLAQIRRAVGPSRVREVMVEFGLDPDLRQPVRHYSLGMKQKLGLAQAFLEHPRVLILDEPFNALDSRMVDALRQKLLLFRNSGGTVVFTSHNQEDIDVLADQVLAVDDTRLRAERSTDGADRSS